jgi:hypothetical protein
VVFPPLPLLDALLLFVGMPACPSPGEGRLPAERGREREREREREKRLEE